MYHIKGNTEHMNKPGRTARVANDKDIGERAFVPFGGTGQEPVWTLEDEDYTSAPSRMVDALSTGPSVLGGALNSMSAGDGIINVSGYVIQLTGAGAEGRSKVEVDFYNKKVNVQ